MPGLVDARAGVGRYSANLGWRDAQVAEVLCRELGLPVTVVHDIFAAAVAEHRYGQAAAPRTSRSWLSAPVSPPPSSRRVSQ